jgi:hypothetical protein
VLSNLFGDRGVVKVGWGFDKGDITMLKAAANGAFEEVCTQNSLSSFPYYYYYYYSRSSSF